MRIHLRSPFDDHPWGGATLLTLALAVSACDGSTVTVAPAICGDGQLEQLETCDDANVIAGDGCSEACQIESAWRCEGQPSSCEPLCQSASDCDDDNPCTDDVCSATGVCGHANNGAACDDGVFCNGVDTCDAGTCTHGGDPCSGESECSDSCDEIDDDCFADEGLGCIDDGNVCTDNVCNALGACVAVNNTASCDDGVFCNGVDTCSGGSCSHTGDPCSSGTECADNCDETDDDCFADEGQACTDDGSVCTDNVCSALGACAAVNNTASCDDGLYCNGDDTCAGGVCGHSGSPCGADGCDESGDVCGAGMRFVSVTPGWLHSCGLTADGTAYCWGLDSQGQLGNGPLLTDSQDTPSPVDTSTMTGNKAFIHLAAGESHTCGIAADGAAYCWGAGSYGRLGNGSSSNEESPSPVDISTITGNSAFVQISGSFYHTCAVMADGRAYCWGRDLNGALGNGVFVGADQLSPSAVSTSGIGGSKAFVQIETAVGYTCAVMADGAGYCWGNDNSGELGNGSESGNQYTPSQVDTSTISGNKAFVQISGGGSHTCAVTADGLAYCWGLDSAGRVGDGGAAGSSFASPVAVDMSPIAADAAFVQVSAGLAHSCGTTSDGAAYCWGSDSNSALGNGLVLTSDQPSPSPVDVTSIAGSTAFVEVYALRLHTCGLTTDGVAHCWGSDSNGQLGNGSTATEDQESPSQVDDSTMPRYASIVDITAGEAHACARTPEGEAYCWGSDSSSELGNGSTTGNQDSPSPVDLTPVTGESAWRPVAAGSGCTCAASGAGVAYCWGRDGDAQLGNGDVLTANQESPSLVDTAPVAGSSMPIGLAIGRWHACALMADGVPYCWGRDDFAQLGNGDLLTVTQESPSAVDLSPVTGNSAFVQLSGPGHHTCGLTAEGLAYCWGRDDVGQLGNGDTLTANQPSPSAVDVSTVTGSTTLVKVVGGGEHSCALTSAGVAYCWGSDVYGQLGNGDSLVANQDSPSPVDTSTITGNPVFVQLSGGLYHTCGVTAEGDGYCWGRDDLGQLGNGDIVVTSQASPSPVDTSTISGNSAFVAMTGGEYFTCGLMADGAAYCWGYDGFNQLGNGDGGTLDQESPSPVDMSGL